MQRLIQIGFQHVGQWKLAQDGLRFELKSHGDTANVLYAFIHEGRVMYIGKTTKPLKIRMYWYQNPGPTQSTNVKNHGNIKQLLSNGSNVDIFVLVDSGLLHHGGFHLNLAAGLEDSLIVACSPPWNGRGVSRDKNNKLPELERSPVNTEAISENSAPDTGQVHFAFQLGATYFKQGFFNVSVHFEKFFGADGALITISCTDEASPIKGHINRTANMNKAPRIMGGRYLKAWFQKHCQLNSNIQVVVHSKTSISLARKR